MTREDEASEDVAIVMDQHELPERLTTVVTRLARQLRRVAVTGGLTPSQAGTLYTLARSSMTVTQLAASERVQGPTMTGIVGRLEALGFAKRKSDLADRRIVRVEITDEGRRVSASRHVEARAMFAEQLGALTSNQRVVLEEAVELLDTFIFPR